MPGRISRSSVPVAHSGKPAARPKAAHKRKRRGLDAFAIAERQDPLRTKIRQHRLGEAEGEGPRQKKQRLLDDDDEQDESTHSGTHAAQHASTEKGERDELDLSGGSDSEGNEWRMGEVDKENDSDIDSDEAFGESDEEKFEGFSFGRGREQRDSKPQRKSGGRLSSQIPDPEDMGDFDDEIDQEEDDLGDDAVDLANILDQSYEDSDNEDSEPQGQEQDFAARNLEDSIGDSSEDDSEDEGSSFSMSDVDSEEDEQETRQQLKDMVASFSKSSKNDNEESENANQNPTLASALAALKESSGLDPAFEKEVNKLSRNLKQSKNGKSNNLVHAPLPKRQQDRIDRKAAYGKAKETLDKWIDTVKHNRRAEHLMFPLQDPHAQEPQGTSTMIPTGQSKPETDLEQTIQGILEQSGLAGSGNQPEEGQIKGFEELQTNKMPLEEVLARRAELRKARELLFREEVRAKRIKKIKSKAYRRVHRKEAQRAAQKERDLLKAAGVELSEDEKEANDRRRAEERMGARHRESKWAKSVKQTGRAAWDEFARDGVTEMARRNEELRQRMEGKQIRPSYNEDSDLSDESDVDEELDNADASDELKLQQQLEKANSGQLTGGEESKLASLKFMQRADATRRQQNDEAAEDLRRELAGEESESESDTGKNVSVGRRVFGPTSGHTAKPIRQIEQNEFEEPEGSADELDVEDDKKNIQSTSTGDLTSISVPSLQQTRETKSNLGPALAKADTKVFAPKAKPQRPTNNDKPQVAKQTVAPNNTESWTTIQHPDHVESEPERDETYGDEMSSTREFLVPSNLELVRSAFGGDDVEASFAAEKASAESSEDEKVTDNALPGWGTWTGDGISKRERKRIQERTKGRFLSKQEGVKPADRKDKGLQKVIISEKRSKKNAKYLASTLPHPFESRQQYERTIRQPIGPEWTTKETFQSTTKPRVLVRPGRRIEPMSAPML